MNDDFNQTVFLSLQLKIIKQHINSMNINNMKSLKMNIAKLKMKDPTYTVYFYVYLYFGSGIHSSHFGRAQCSGLHYLKICFYLCISSNSLR